MSKTILLSRSRNYRITPKWYIIYLQTVASNVFQSVKLFFSCCARPSFRFIPFKLTQDWTSNNINLWKKIQTHKIVVPQVKNIISPLSGDSKKYETQSSVLELSCCLMQPFAQYKCRANYKYIQRTNKTNISKQLLVSCLHIHQACNMWDIEHKFLLIYRYYK